MVPDQEYRKTYPAKLIKLINEFKKKYKPYNYISFYLNYYPVVDLTSYIVYKNDDKIIYDEIFDKFQECLNNYKTYEEYKNYKYLSNMLKDSNYYKNLILNEPLAIETTEENKRITYNRISDDDEYENKIVSILDDYYNAKFYNNFLRFQNNTANYNFVVSILNEYIYLIPDKDKVEEFIRDKDSKLLYRKVFSRDITDFSSVFMGGDFYDRTANYILEYYKTKALEANLKYYDIKEFLI